MENSRQKNAFLKYEADAWFGRNKKIIESYSVETDKVVSLITDYRLKPKRLLEVGCSAGYRLNGIKQMFKNCDVFGIEPSLAAINYGKKKYPLVNFQKGTADDMRCYKSESMDIVIVGFVFYVVDRSVLLKAVAEIDRVLKNGGELIIIDFFSEKPNKNRYKHIKNDSAFAYKQNYEAIFTSANLYHLLSKSTFSHIAKAYDASKDYFDKYSITLLKKDINASYK